jgi:hypothetical protein
MKFLNMLGLAAGLLACTALRAELVTIQEAIEAYDIEVILTGKGEGYALARTCAGCQPTRLDIDARTTVTIDGRAADANEHIEKHWSGGVVIYDIRTRRIVRLKL